MKRPRLVRKNPSGGQWAGLLVGGIGGGLVGSVVGVMGALLYAGGAASGTASDGQNATVLRNAALITYGADLAGIIGGAALGYHVGG